MEALCRSVKRVETESDGYDYEAMKAVTEELRHMTPDKRASLLTMMARRRVRPIVTREDLTIVFNRLVPNFRSNPDLCLRLDIAVRFWYMPLAS